MPFGQTGGDPVSAVLIDRVAETEYETGLAAIGSVNALNRIASIFLGLLAVSYARIHWQNLVNFGIVPLEFGDRKNYDEID